MADSVTGIVLDIPADVLQNIKNADKAIKDLEKTSRQAATNIKKDFDNTMVSGVNAFIKKIEEAQGKLNNLTMSSVGAKKLNLGDIGAGATKSASDISTLVQSLSQLTAALEKNKSARTASKNVTSQETEYSRLSAELAKQAERYTQLSLAIEAYNQKKHEETTKKERIQNTANLQELQTLQQTLPLLREKVALMERNARMAQTANNPTLQTRRAQEELTQMNKMYAEEEKASAKKAAQLEKDRQREAAAAQKAYEQQQKLYDKLFGKGGVQDKQVQQALALQKAQILATPQGAIDYAKNARHLKEMTEAYKNLKAVMATTKPDTKEWMQMNAQLEKTRNRIDEIRKKMGESKNTAQGMDGVAASLARTLAATFSASAITGYINKMIQVRAQFELQQTALRAILQNKEEADRIFLQVQQMALQSPFSIMQMTTYTKQLAAYRIESEKLVGTTKMLADVSAGLGVDIGRLILAYGQVKAANYLRACLGRGTKVKMFDGTFKNVEDVVLGDVLMGDDEQPRHVSKLYQGEQQMYRVSYLGGEFRCNEHHILTVYDALKLRVTDVFVLDYLKEPYRYHGVKRIDGKYKTFIMKVEPDNIDTYYGFSIDCNRRFIIEDNVVTHNTEVRQFTEAGLNIAGELANYFSELQGKMISVGEVMEMITKRMVRFEDVEEVFKRVTSAGGLFYDMQKKQSETLWGQLQRIKDAMSIMFNEIGKDNEGIIMTFVKLIRTLISSWRELSNVITPLVTGWLAYIAVTKVILGLFPAIFKGLGNIVVLFKAATKHSKLAGAAMNKAFTGGIIGLITTIGFAIYELSTHTDELTRSLNEIAEEGKKDAQEMSNKYKLLADEIKDVNTTYERRNELMNEIKRTYAGILDDQFLELENIQNMSDGYAEATKSIKQYYSAQAHEKQKEKSAENVQKEFQDVLEDVVYNTTYLFRDFATEDIVKHFTSQILDEIQEGAITSSEEAARELAKRIYKYYDRPADKLFERAIEQNKNFLIDSDTFYEAIKAINEYNKTVGNLGKTIGETAEETKDIRFAESVMAGAKADLRELEDYRTLLTSIYKMVHDGTVTFDGIGNILGTDEESKLAIKRLEEYNSHLQELGLTINTMNFSNILRGLDSITDYINDLAMESFEKRGPLARYGNFFNSFNKLFDKYKLSDAQKTLRDFKQTVVNETGIAASALDKFNISADQSLSDIRKSVEGNVEILKQSIEEYTTSYNSLLNVGAGPEVANKKALDVAKINDIKDAQKELKALLLLLSLLGGKDKDADKGASQKWSSRLSLIKEMNKEYEKLLKYYSKEDAMAKIRSSYGAAVADAFKGTKWADITSLGIFDKQNTANLLRDIGATAGGEFRKNFLKEAGTLESEIEIKVREDEIQQAKDEIQKAFDNYELTKTLGNLGLNVDLTYMVGGQPMTLSQIRKDIEDKLKVAKATDGQEELVKAYEDYLRKVADMENKAAVERLKNYNKYLLESMSERVQIELKAQQEIRKIRQDETLDDFSKDQAVEQVKKKMQEELTKFDFGQFKSSDVYLDTFKDLEKASKEQLQYVIDRLKELQSATKDLSPIQVKSIAQEIKKAQDALGERTSFTDIGKNLTESIKYAKERGSLISQQVALQKQLTAEEDKLSEAEKKLFDLTVERDAIQDESSDAWVEANAEVEKQQQTVADIQKSVEGISTALDGVTEKISKGEQAWAIFRGAISKTRDAIGQANEAVNSIFEGMDSMDLISDSMRDGFESVSEIIGGIDKALAGLESIDITKPFSVVTGIGKTIGGVFSTIGGIFGLGDKKKERQIQRLQDKVEDLQKAYEKLGTAIEEAYDYDYYNLTYARSMKNLEEQRKAIEEQIALEEAKKKTDKDKIKEYEDALEELAEKEKELREERYREMGSLGKSDVLSEAENYVSVWLDAYKEMGDGLDALNEHWDEFFENLVLKQAASAIVSKRMTKYVDMINAAIDKGDTGLSLAQTFAQIGQNLKDELGTWNEDLKSFFDAVGIKGIKGELGLSDLQKGIQNITEPQAAAIEAYLNSMRFAVFEQNTLLTQMLSAIQTQYGTSADNPVLNEVKSIRRLVASIDARLKSVIVGMGTNQKGIKVA